MRKIISHTLLPLAALMLISACAPSSSEQFINKAYNIDVRNQQYSQSIFDY